MPSSFFQQPTNGLSARIVDAELNALLAASGAVLVEGSKASGKTAAASQGAKNLRALAKRMEHSDLGKPAALAVIVPQGYGAVKYGEVGIVPIGALGP